MANPEHVRMLKEGGEAWNKWRINKGIRIADLTSAEFRGARLGWDYRDVVFFTHINLSGCDLTGAVFSGADFASADLIGANFSSADLSGADLRSANMSRAILRGASLRQATLYGVDFSDADLMDTDFDRAKLGSTIFSNNDLSGAKGLDTVTHLTRSVISIDAIYRSKGNIDEGFLRGAGVPDQFITYARSLVGKAIEFYSCFISYSSKDQDFAEQTYKDLQAKGIRCWFAPEDLKIGDPFRQKIDESIRLHDKLLLILSENSILSRWIEDEVESALERERKESRLVLFPISIDSAVWDSERAWVASLRRMRHIGDFKDWKHHDGYEKAFNKLMRDLTTE